MALAIYEAGFAISQPIAGGTAISGTYASRDHLCGLLEMVLPFVVMYALARIREQDRSPVGLLTASFALAAGLMILVAITFTFSKMGIASMLSSFLIMGLASIPGETPQRRKLALYCMAAAICLAFFFSLPLDLVGQFGAAAGDPTAEGRLPIWRDTLHLIANYPLFGCGLGGYVQGFMRYQTAGLHFGWAEAHNDYLQLIAELGVVGFIIPATFSIAALAQATRTARHGTTRDIRYAALACVGGLSAMLVHSFADFNMHIPANAMVFWWIGGIAVALGETRTSGKDRGVFRYFALALGLFVAVSAVAWFLFLSFFRADIQAERQFCRLGICDTDTVRSAETLLHGGRIALVPNKLLEAFLRRDPAMPYRWEDLGESLEAHGHTPAARRCFTRALVLGPNLPYTLYRAAEFHFLLTEDQIALKLVAHALQGDPTYQDRVFPEYLRRKIPLTQILALGLPHAPSYAAFLRFLIAQRRTPDAAQTWSYILAQNYADTPLADDYTSFLLQNKQPESAAQAWAQYAGKLEKGYPDCNRIFNGGFESKLTGSAFDWSLEQNPGVAVSVDTSVAHSGSHSLRIDFDGSEKVASIGLRQTVFLKPGHYRFQAYAKLDNIVTDQGIAFHVASQHAPNLLTVTTDPLLGSSDWKLIQQSFTVSSAAAGLAQIDLVRAPAFPFPSLIRGTLWIDSVSIAPE